MIVATATLGSTRHAAAQIIDSYFPSLGTAVGSIQTDFTQSPVLDEYAPASVRIHSFIVDGDFAELLGYDTNVDGLPGGHSSPVVNSTGDLSIRSDWTQHSLHADLSVNDVRFPTRTIQDRTNWTASLGGVYELGRDKLGVSYTHLNLVQTPTDVGAIVSTQPIFYQIDAAGMSYTVTTHSPLSVTPEFNATQYRFETPALSSGTQDQSYRNRVELTETATGRYELAPDRSIVLVLQGAEIRYQGKLAGLPGRDANGGSVLAGVDLGPSGPFRIRALAGYQLRSYRSSLYQKLQSPIVEVELGWLPTRLTTVSLAVRTGIEDSAVESVVDYTYTSARLAVRHEYQRNIILGAYVQLQNANYPSTPLLLQYTALNQDRLDQTIYSAGCSASLLINRHLRLTATYDFSSQNVVDTGRFATNEFLAGLHFVF